MRVDAAAAAGSTPTVTESTSGGVAAERRLVDVVEQLLTDCTSASSPDLTRRVLAASMTALDAVAVRLVAEDGQVLADWRRAVGAPHRRDTVALTANLPDGSRLTVTWDGPPTVTPQQLRAVAALVGMVEERTAAGRHADLRLRRQRRAWGQEIHDGVTQSVTAAVMMLERVKSLADDDALVPAIECSQEEIRSSLRELRDVLAQVVDDEPSDAGDDGQTLAELVEDIRARWRLQARIATRGDLSGLADDVAAVARAVVREALINVAKHANARHVTVSVNHELDVVRVQITDDGGGIDDDLQWTRSNLRMGLRLMEQRVALVGGSLGVDSEAGRGTTVLAVLPRPSLGRPALPR